MVEQSIIDEALKAKSETAQFDFKEEFDPDSKKDWCEIIKDIVAMANSGGGVILIGLGDNGKPIKFDLRKVFRIDPAQITDKINRYTGVQFARFQLEERKKKGQQIACLNIDGVDCLIAFNKPGTYPKSDGSQGRAFSEGSVYIRHGAKSEPCNTSDLREFQDKQLELERKKILEGITRVVEAPRGYDIRLIPSSEVVDASTPSMPVKVVDDDSGIPVHVLNPDDAYPFRTTDVVTAVNQKIAPYKISQYDVVAIKFSHKIPQESNYYYKSMMTSPQYSTAFIDWLVDEYHTDNNFFLKARKNYRNRKR